MDLTDDFKPPIRSRSDKEIARIVALPHKWNEKAVRIAQEEIVIRNIEVKQIRQARYLEEKKERIEASKLANEKFSFFTLDFEKLLSIGTKFFCFYSLGIWKKTAIQKKQNFNVIIDLLC